MVYSYNNSTSSSWNICRHRGKIKKYNIQVADTYNSFYIYIPIFERK